MSVSGEWGLKCGVHGFGRWSRFPQGGGAEVRAREPEQSSGNEAIFLLLHKPPPKPPHPKPPHTPNTHLPTRPPPPTPPGARWVKTKYGREYQGHKNGNFF